MSSVCASSPIGKKKYFGFLPLPILPVWLKFLHLRYKVNMSNYAKSSKGNKVSRKNSALKILKFCLMYIYIFSLQDRHCLKISLQKKCHFVRTCTKDIPHTYFCKCQTTGKYLVGILFEGAFCFAAPLCSKYFD